MRLLNNVERARQMTSTPLQHSEYLQNKRNVEWMLKQSLKAFKLFQHRCNILSTRFNNVEGGWQTLSTLPFNKIERMLKQMLKPFARAFRRFARVFGLVFKRRLMLLRSTELMAWKGQSQFPDCLQKMVLLL